MTTTTKLRRPARSAVLVASVEIRTLDGRVVGASVATGKTASEAIKAAVARLPEVR